MRWFRRFRRSGGVSLEVLLREWDRRGWVFFDGDSGKWLPVVWGCVSLIVDRLYSLGVRVLRDDASVVGLPQWLRKPNAAVLNGSDLVAQAAFFLVRDGEFFLVPLRDGSGRVAQVALPDPRQVSDVAGEWRWRGVSLGEVVHQRYMFTPGSRRGQGPLDAAVRAAKLGSLSQQYAEDLLVRGAAIQYALSTPQSLSVDSRKELVAEIVAAHHGPERGFARPMVLDGGLKVEPLSMTAEEAEFQKMVTWNDARIASQIFKIDGSLLGIVQPGSRLTYQNQQDRETNLWNDCLLPYARRIERAFSVLLPAGQHVDLDERSLLWGGPRDRVAAAEKMASMVAGGKPVFGVNEVREMLGYPPVDEAQLAAVSPQTPPAGAQPEGVEDEQQEPANTAVS